MKTQSDKHQRGERQRPKKRAEAELERATAAADLVKAEAVRKAARQLSDRALTAKKHKAVALEWQKKHAHVAELLVQAGLRHKDYVE